MNEGFGKELSRTGNSVKRSGPFSEPLDSKNQVFLHSPPSQISAPTRFLRFACSIAIVDPEIWLGLLCLRFVGLFHLRLFFVAYRRSVWAFLLTVEIRSEIRVGLLYLRLGLFHLRLVFVAYRKVVCFFVTVEIRFWSFLLTVESRFGLFAYGSPPSRNLIRSLLLTVPTGSKKDKP